VEADSSSVCVRLCLDEHYSADIANGLRALAHDACAVKERAELIALDDPDLLAILVPEGRALVTENVADFAPLTRDLLASGGHHFGLIYTSSRSMPRSRQTIGLFVQRLDEVMKDHPGDDDFRDVTHWL
jgi:hypothetical protein